MTEDVTGSRFGSRLLPAVLFTFILLAGGCAQKPGSTSRPATIQPISNAQQMDDVIALLNDGREKEARKLLHQMLKRDPSDSTATRLIASLDADPVATLGTKSFEYRAQPGDTMVELAKRFLDDPLKFHTLAKYNGMPVPSALRAGQIIRIPGDAPKAAAASRPTPAEDARPAASSAPSRAAAPQAAPAPDRARASALRGAGLSALNQGQLARAVVLLHQASTLDPGNALIKRDLERAIRIRKTVKAKR